jgi:LPXTG-motif cell wall-anchored protein
VIGALLFAPAAFAQSSSASASGCTTSPTDDGESVTVCVDHPASSSASSSSTATAEADDAQYKTASPTLTALPETGGSVSLVGAMLPLALLVGGGLLAFRTVRRS